MRAGIVGCGHIAEKHLHQLKRMRGITVVGVCDRNPKSAARLAERFGIEKDYHDVATFLRNGAPQVVHILTPPQTHQEIALEAMAEGCHVLVEKPLAVHSREAEMMINKARREGVRLGVCHNFLFVPAFAEAYRLIRSGRLGRILSAELFWKVTSFEAGRSRRIPSWIGDLPGDIFQEIAPHPVYLLQAVLGDLKVISATAKAMMPDQPYRADEMKVIFDSESGLAVMSISVGTQPVQKALRIYGTDMTLHIDLATSTLLKLKPHGHGDAGRALVNIDRSLQTVARTGINVFRHILGKLPRGHAGAITQFYDRLDHDHPNPIDGFHGARTVLVLDRIWAAMRWPG